MEIVIANTSHCVYAEIISTTIAASANVRGTGIAQRTSEYIRTKIENGNGVIALKGTVFAGFCYIESWNHGKFVANSGLIVHPDFRNIGLAKKIKAKIFQHSRTKFPTAKIFSITTGLPVMKLNSDLGYKPVPFSELTNDQCFWNGCKTCKNYDVLQRTKQKMCLCTGMLYDPSLKETTNNARVEKRIVKSLKYIKEAIYLKKQRK